MARRPKQLPPICPQCGANAALVTGDAIYADAGEALARKHFWACLKDQVWVGCHPGTKWALGVMADAQLRQARMMLHERRLDPIWKGAIAAVGYEPEDGRARAKIMGVARARVYAYLAWKLGIDREECHTAMFDLETCRRAWTALAGASYADIRDWYKARNPPAKRTNDGEQQDRGAASAQP